MRIFLLILCFFWMVLPQAAEDVYRYVDEHGNVIYSDTPVEGAEKIRVDEIQTIQPGEVPPFQYTPPAEEVAAYSRLEITSPENDSVVRFSEGPLTVSGVVEPGLNLKAGHYFVLYVDGDKIASGTSPQFTLSSMDRGTHTMNLAVVDQSGSQVITSADVTFTVYQHAVAKPKP